MKEAATVVYRNYSFIEESPCNAISHQWLITVKSKSKPKTLRPPGDMLTGLCATCHLRSLLYEMYIDLIISFLSGSI
jgi:hypothetical protein